MTTRRGFITSILPVSVLAALLGGCGKDDKEKDLEITQRALNATKSELASTKAKLRAYEDKKALDQQKVNVVELHLSDADVLKLQGETLPAILPAGAVIDPVLTTLQHRDDGTSYLFSSGGIAFSRKNDLTYLTEFYLSSGQLAEDKKGRQQFYSIHLELNNPTGDEVTLKINQVEVSFEGQGPKGTARYPSYPRSFTASEIVKDPKLSALLPIITYMAAESDRAGMPKADVFLAGLQPQNTTRPAAGAKAKSAQTSPEGGPK